MPLLGSCHTTGIAVVSCRCFGALRLAAKAFAVVGLVSAARGGGVFLARSLHV